MKKMIFGIFATVLLVSISYGQSNNPYNKLGADVASAYKVILNDYEQGKIKDVDQNTLNHYFESALSGYPSIKMDEFTKVFNALKSATNKSVINNSGLSIDAKEFLNLSLTDNSITALVNDVNKSKIADNEKQIVLSVLAINYNLIKPEAKSGQPKTSGKGPSADFNFADGNSLTLESQKGTTVLWGAIGFVNGFGICGMPCGIVGGVLGLILGGFSNSGNTSTGGNSNGGWHPQP